MKVVILAGGKGTRLKPFTNIVPKPLLPMKERPILEHIILYLKKHGLTDIIISIGYLGYQIRNYFGDGSEWGINIEYVEEKEPMGHAGCLNLMKDKLKETFILMGGDNITNLDLTEFIKFHKEKKGILSVALFEHTETIPWGVYDLDQEMAIEKFREKPTITHKAGTMIFCLEPRIFDFIGNKPGIINITDHIIPELLERGEKIYGFPFTDYWIDIGKLEDYNKINGI